MPEIHLGTHTIRSHGVKVARLHMHDWVILVLLVVIEVILNIINLFYRFVGESMMTDLRYPLQDNTIPFWEVPVIAVLLPFAIFLVYYLFRRDVYDLHQAILGLLFSALITGVITDAIKDAVGRPRPDFFWRCFPDGKPEYDSITRGVICHGDRSVVKEGHKSFPSGHTSYDVGRNENDNQQSSEVNSLQMQGTELREIYIPSEDCLDTSVVATSDNIPMINGFGAGRRSCDLFL